jgi:SpoVK/Ycf46/Vps4 family AAA+-type ATPase
MRKDHPLQVVYKAFRRHFTREFRPYVLKRGKDTKTDIKHLCKKIERATMRLRSETSSMSEASTEEDDVRFSDKVLGDVKRFIAIMLFTTFKFY